MCLSCESALCSFRRDRRRNGRVWIPYLSPYSLAVLIPFVFEERNDFPSALYFGLSLIRGKDLSLSRGYTEIRFRLSPFLRYETS